METEILTIAVAGSTALVCLIAFVATRIQRARKPVRLPRPNRTPHVNKRK